ncbi:IpaD/SipD/SspD family type III secretion system needle tip protein [Proteus sp. fly-1013]|uniref:IpaD/SipD/SspD family type III secretion system needle tip protein n=1 Tax=Proteus sp. fly-1013 TaxID=3136673 RepID=UPI0032DAEED0
MAIVIDSNVSKSNKKIDANTQLSNNIDYNRDDFSNNTHFLLEEVKREYQDIFTYDLQKNKKLENLSQKERYFFLDEQYVKNYVNQQKSLNEINNTSRTIKNLQPDNSYPTDSLSDLFNDIKQSIIAGKNDYLDVLKDIFSKYMDFVNALREALSKLSEYTEAGGKDGYINVDLSKIADEINKIINEFTNNESIGKLFFGFEMSYFQDKDGRYYRIVNNEKIYYESFSDLYNAKAKVADLLNGIKGIFFHESSSKDPSTGEECFKIEAGIDLSDIERFLKSLKENGLGKKDMLQTEFDLLKKAIDALEKKINTNLDELSKKYSSANSNYDNFVKIVSSTMNTLLEMAKGFLRF